MKRGLSTIVSTLLILLLVFVAVGILWVVVRNVVMQGTEQVSLGKFTLDLAIDQVQLNNATNSVSMKIKRNPGDGEFVGIKVIVFDEDNSEIFTINGSLKEYERKSYSFILQLIDVDNVKKIQIAPVFLLSSGKEAVGDVKDTWEKSESASGSYIEIPNGNNSNLGLECTVDSNCTGIANSGNYCSGENVVRNNYDYFCNSLNECDYNSTTSVVENCSATGKICSGGICVSLICSGDSTQSCTIANGVGGQTRICTSGVWSSWGTCILVSCNSGYTPSGNSCVEEQIEDDLVILYYNNFEQNQVGSSSYKNDWSYCMPNPDAGIYKSSSDSQNPTNVFRAYFPKGSWSLNNENGFRCHIEYNENGYDELYLSYRIKFQSGFDAVKGGKLPRLESYPSRFYTSLTCPDGTDEFTGGMMFKKGDLNNPIPVFYLTHPDMWNATWYRETFYSMTGHYPEDCDEVVDLLGAVYSESIYWDETIPRGEWHTITERVVPNTPGQYDGFVEGYIDGQLITQVTNLRFRDVSDLKINRFNFVGFFGGGDDSWATVKDEYIYYDNLMIYYYESELGEHEPSPVNRVLPEMDYPLESILI